MHMLRTDLYPSGVGTEEVLLVPGTPMPVQGISSGQMISR